MGVGDPDSSLEVKTLPKLDEFEVSMPEAKRPSIMAPSKMQAREQARGEDSEPVKPAKVDEGETVKLSKDEGEIVRPKVVDDSVIQECLEKMLSKKNLGRDQFLRSRINPQMYTPISALMKHARIQALNITEEKLLEVAKKSPRLGIDAEGKMIRPMLRSKRNTIIVREFPWGEDVLRDEILGQYEDKEAGLGPEVVVSIKADVNDTWFVKCVSDEATVRVAKWLKEQKYQDWQGACAIKSEYFLRSFFPVAPQSVIPPMASTIVGSPTTQNTDPEDTQNYSNPALSNNVGVRSNLTNNVSWGNNVGLGNNIGLGSNLSLNNNVSLGTNVGLGSNVSLGNSGGLGHTMNNISGNGIATIGAGPQGNTVIRVLAQVNGGVWQPWGSGFRRPRILNAAPPGSFSKKPSWKKGWNTGNSALIGEGRNNINSTASWANVNNMHPQQSIKKGKGKGGDNSKGKQDHDTPGKGKQEPDYDDAQEKKDTLTHAKQSKRGKGGKGKAKGTINVQNFDKIVEDKDSSQKEDKSDIKNDKNGDKKSSEKDALVDKKSDDIDPAVAGRDALKGDGNNRWNRGNMRQVGRGYHGYSWVDQQWWNSNYYNYYGYPRQYYNQQTQKKPRKPFKKEEVPKKEGEEEAKEGEEKAKEVVEVATATTKPETEVTSEPAKDETEAPAAPAVVE